MTDAVAQSFGLMPSRRDLFGAKEDKHFVLPEASLSDNMLMKMMGMTGEEVVSPRDLPLVSRPSAAYVFASCIELLMI